MTILFQIFISKTRYKHLLHSRFTGRKLVILFQFFNERSFDTLHIRPLLGMLSHSKVKRSLFGDLGRIP